MAQLIISILQRGTEGSEKLSNLPNNPCEWLGQASDPGGRPATLLPAGSDRKWGLLVKRSLVCRRSDRPSCGVGGAAFQIPSCSLPQ